MKVIDNSVPYRHEYKYIISSAQLMLLKSRISSIMQLDKHTDEQGKYNIRSLYFDDYYNRCYYENENGTDPREKFRIRIYNKSTDVISLECKRKEHDKTHKLSTNISFEQCKQLVNGNKVLIIDTQPALINKMLIDIQSRMLHPVVIVEYDRIPYVYKNGNVRVTFDMNISGSDALSDFLKGDLHKRPIMPAGMHLMEVKFDEFLPDYIYKSLNLNQLQRTTYSKFYLSRKFTMK